MVKLINNQDRKKLGEGRNYQMGFGFCKKVDENTYETVQPISACKDYLNDVVYSEITGKPIKVYGADIFQTNIFNGDFSYLAFGILTHISDCNKKQPFISSSEYNYKKFCDDKDRLAKNINNVQRLINFVESEFKLESFTIIKTISENSYLAILPIFWTKYTYLISLYSLLLRMGQYYDGSISEEEFLNKYCELYSLDKSLWDKAIYAYKWLLNNKLIGQDFNQLIKDEGVYGVHNFGICSLKNPDTGKVFSSKW